MALMSIISMKNLPSNLSSVNKQTEATVIEDKGYLEALRDSLEAEIVAHEQQKSFYDYSLKDVLTMLNTKPKVKKQLPLPTLMLKVLEIKIKKSLRSEDSIENLKSALFGVALGLSTFQIISTL